MCKGTTTTTTKQQARSPSPSPNPKHHMTMNKKRTTPSSSSSSSITINVDSLNSTNDDDNNNDNESSYYPGSICELCGSKATVYCQADDAYLCGRCDGWVHGANFLANRHVRCVLCDTCHRFSSRFLVGTSRQVELPEVVVGGKRSRRSHCDGRNDCSSLRILKRPFLFI